MAGTVKELSPPQVTVEEKENSLVEMRIETTADDTDAAVRTAFTHLGSHVRVPGFRPGKVPVPVLEKMIPWESLRRDLLEDWVPDVYVKALDVAGLDPVADPEIQVETLERGEPLVFTAKVTVRPKVDLGAYATALSVPRVDPSVSDEEVESELKELQRVHASRTTVERPAQMGDALRGTFVIKDKEGTILQGSETAEDVIVLDTDKTAEALITPLLGMGAGDEREFSATLPATDNDEAHEVSVSAKVRAVDEITLHPLDDELGTKEGKGSLDELRDSVRVRRQEEEVRKEEERLARAVMDGLGELATCDVPDVMVENELERQWRILEQRVGMLGLDMERYMGFQGQTREQLRGQWRQDAIRTVRDQLVLDSLADEEGVEVDGVAVEAEVSRALGRSKVTHVQKLNARINTEARMRRAAALERAIEIATAKG